MLELVRSLFKKATEKAQDDVTNGLDGGEFWTAIVVIVGTVILVALHGTRAWWFACVLILPTIAVIYYTHSIAMKNSRVTDSKSSALIGIGGTFGLVFLASKMFEQASFVNLSLLFLALTMLATMLLFVALFVGIFGLITLKKSSVFLILIVLFMSIFGFAHLAALLENYGSQDGPYIDAQILVAFAV